MTGPVALPNGPFLALIQPVSTPTLPTISAVSPSTGTVNTPVQILITGTGFASGVTVSVEDAAVDRVEFVSATQIRAWITPIQVGAKDVSVLNSDGTGVISSDAFTISARVLLDQTMSESATLAASTQIRNADVTGKWKYVNATTASSISGGVLIVEDTALRIADARTDRPRQEGRQHYSKVTFQAAGTFHIVQPLVLCDEVSTNSTQWWAGNQGVGFQIKTGPDLRWKRSSTSDGIFCHKTYSGVALNATLECMLIERGSLGVFGLIKESGTWRIKAIDHEFANQDCRLGIGINGATAGPNIDRFTTRETGWTPEALVSHSFDQTDAVTIGASDGNGSAESGGVGVTPSQTGLITVASDRCTLSGDGTGYVLWDAGAKEVILSAQLTVRDSSRVGLIVRGTNQDNCYLIRLDSSANTIVLVKREAGSESTLATGSLGLDTPVGDLASGTEYWVSAVCDGNQIRAWVDGTAALHNSYVESTNSFNENATKHGLVIEKGASVTAAAARNVVMFALTQTPPEV